MASSTKRRLLTILKLVDLVRLEQRSAARRRRPDLWRRGFASDAATIYGFDQHDRSDYVSDLDRYTKTPFINGSFTSLLDNKVVFHEALARSCEEYLPPLLGVIVHGRFRARPVSGARSGASVRDLLLEHGGLVLKPVASGGGSNIHLLRHTGAGIVHNGAVVGPDDIDALQARLGEYLVGGLLEQHRYAAEIFPGTVNTIRILTLRDPGSDEPFLATAIHRFGSTRSGAVDNWEQGGLSCHIDLDDGTLGPGAAFSLTGELTWHDAHPDTGTALTGQVVPGWDDVLALVRRLADALPYLDYVGWDLVVTEQGPRVIEGNNYTGVRILQVHRPLLADPRVRAFYRAHGVD